MKKSEILSKYTLKVADFRYSINFYQIYISKIEIYQLDLQKLKHYQNLLKLAEILTNYSP